MTSKSVPKEGLCQLHFKREGGKWHEDEDDIEIAFLFDGKKLLYMDTLYEGSCRVEKKYSFSDTTSKLFT